MLIDFHTYHIADNVFGIENLTFDQSIGKNYFTFGLHPWFIPETSFELFEQRLRLYHTHEKFVGLGEIGLDRVRLIDFELQKSIFSKQLSLAAQLNIKIVVVHCVRALADVFEVLKKSSFSGILIFHDANFSLEDSKRLIEMGHYLSFGTNLMRENSKASRHLVELDLDHVFFESDEGEISIAEVYKQAAKLLSIDELVLEAKILKNFQLLLPHLKFSL